MQRTFTFICHISCSFKINTMTSVFVLLVLYTLFFFKIQFVKFKYFLIKNGNKILVLFYVLKIFILLKGLSKNVYKLNYNMSVFKKS